jgi:hypothetical protein
MKAILRWSAGLSCLLFLAAATQAQDRVWISAALKTPLPIAPSPRNTAGFYIVNPYGVVYGPNYFLTPPCRPFNGILPGPIGQAIMAGNLPHDLLMCKEAMTIGNAPLMGQKKTTDGPNGPVMPPTSPFPGYGMPTAGGPSPNMQVPFYGPPYYTAPMPYPAPPVANAPQYPMPRPIGYVPYYGPPGMVAMAQRDPRTGIWQVQNIAPSPFAPIPNYNPAGPSGMPMQGGPMPMPMPMPMPPNMNGGPGFQNFGPMQRFDQFGPMQGPQPPTMGPVNMQLPRMESHGPPPQPRPMGYPVHPFTRSPRDFFMWGENMEDERARGRRPFPVP